MIDYKEAHESLVARLEQLHRVYLLAELNWDKEALREFFLDAVEAAKDISYQVEAMEDHYAAE